MDYVLFEVTVLETGDHIKIGIRGFHLFQNDV